MAIDLDDPADWAQRLEETIRELHIWIIDRVAVVPETPSTQDAAFELARGKPGLMLLAERQTAGRGRLGRTWVQHGGLGVAVTFVLDAAKLDAGRLSMAAGVAAAKALDGCVAPPAGFGLRWPNDVVEATGRPGGGRKVAGVLIEIREGLALLGVGVNVFQKEHNFPPELRGSAVSLLQLGPTSDRIGVAQGLLRELHRAMSAEPGLLAHDWTARDVLTGSRQVFIHQHQRVEGIVESIDPAHEIVLRTSPGRTVRLPALATSLVHGR